MGGDGEEGASQLPDARLVEVLQILRCQDQGRLLLPHSFQAVADILHGGEIAQPDVQLVQRGHGVPLGEQLVAEEREHVKQHGVLHTAVGLEQPLHAEDQETEAGDICRPVEELALRPPAHGVEAQQDLPQQFFGV